MIKAFLSYIKVRGHRRGGVCVLRMLLVFFFFFVVHRYNVLKCRNVLVLHIQVDMYNLVIDFIVVFFFLQIFPNIDESFKLNAVICDVLLFVCFVSYFNQMHLFISLSFYFFSILVIDTFHSYFKEGPDVIVTINSNFFFVLCKVE